MDIKLCFALKVLGYLMILLVAAIIGVSYYSVIVLTSPASTPSHLRLSCSRQDLGLCDFDGGSLLSSLILLTWSYFMVVFRDPGAVPQNWGPVPAENLEVGARMTSLDHVAPDTLNPAQSASNALEIRPAVRYCSQCQNGKPPRCHHCSVCQRCVLKMDHHCVWMVNCVGAGNYKFFLLFLLYTFLEATMDTLILLPSFINFFREAKNRSTSPGNLAITFLAFVLNLMFALSLLCFIVMHASLLSSNTATIEVYEKRRDVRWTYDLGRKKNFEQVFGKKKLLWFFPLFAKEDLDNSPALQGLEFPTYSNAEAWHLSAHCMADPFWPWEVQ